MKRSLRFLVRVGMIGAVVCVSMAALCNDGGAPSFTNVDGGTIYVSEPIDYQVSATDPDGDDITYSASLPAGATFDATTQMFSWRPTVAQAGQQTVTFTASDGTNEASMNVTYTVVNPTLAADEPLKFLRPAEGDEFTYGDTLTIAFAANPCASQFQMAIFYDGWDGVCDFVNIEEYWPHENLDSIDLDGNAVRFYREASEIGTSVDMIFYKFPLMDHADFPGGGCEIQLGGGTADKDSVRFAVFDPYIDVNANISDCGSDPTIATDVYYDMNDYNFSKYFTVKASQ